MRRAVGLALAAGLAALGLAGPAAAVTIDWVTVGDAGNAADTPLSNCYAASCGSVAYEYRISKYEVTNAQYAEFLNAVDKNGTNALQLYNPNMGADPSNGGILLVGSNPAGSKYVVKASGGYGGTGFANKPVNYVSFYDALRFANWLNNGQGAASTETGAYTLLGGGPTPGNGATVVREALATTFLPSENEWYKAAYNRSGALYYDYPAGTDAATSCSGPTATANRANCGGGPGTVTDVGSYTGSPSPYGTFDQGGNVWEWNEQIVGVGVRGVRGGAWNASASTLSASARTGSTATTETGFHGFRVASLVPVVVPEPAAALLVTPALLALAARGKRPVRPGV